MSQAIDRSTRANSVPLWPVPPAFNGIGEQRQVREFFIRKDEASQTARVLVVGDHTTPHRRLAVMLASRPQLEVIGEPADDGEALRLLSTLHPDVVLIDAGTSGGCGIELTGRIKQISPAVRVVILADFEDDACLFAAVRGGADGFFPKTSSDEDIAGAILAVKSGEQVVAQRILVHVLRRFEVLVKDHLRQQAGLSEEQIQVLLAMASGATNKQIAKRLCWSNVTIKRRAHEIFRKLGVGDRVRAVAEASRRGLI